MSKLDPEFKAKWCAALRSGEYKQGRHGLRDGDRYCCLGVACDVLDPKGWDGARFGGLAGHMPDAVGHRIGLFRVAMYRLADMNDLDGKSFSEIADYIEANL
jgi:hypothetical protein